MAGLCDFGRLRRVSADGMGWLRKTLSALLVASGNSLTPAPVYSRTVQEERRAVHIQTVVACTPHMPASIAGTVSICLALSLGHKQRRAVHSVIYNALFKLQHSCFVRPVLSLLVVGLPSG